MKIRIINRYFVTTLMLMLSSELIATAMSDYELGLTAYKGGDNAAAVRYFESAQKQGMKSLSLQFNLASSYYKAGRYADAKKYFKQLNNTKEMRDIAEYHLGLIAIKEKSGRQALKHFNTVVSTGEDKRLVKLSEKQLSVLRPKEDIWRSQAFLNFGYDDNISSVTGDSVLDIADSFTEVFASTDYLITGRRKDGWTAQATLFGNEYSDTDMNDQYLISLGAKRSKKLAYWDTSASLSLTKSTYGGDDFQSITKLDIIGQKPITKSDRIYLRYQFEDVASDNPLYDYLEGWRQRGRVGYRNFTANSIKNIYYELELNSRGELVTTTDTYEYSPTRHTIRGTYSYIFNKHWWLNGDLSYQMSDYPVSPTIEREDDQWKLALSADYVFDRTLKLTTKYQYTDNASSVDRYNYDKSIIKVGLSKLF